MGGVRRCHGWDSPVSWMVMIRPGSQRTAVILVMLSLRRTSRVLAPLSLWPKLEPITSTVKRPPLVITSQPMPPPTRRPRTTPIHAPARGCAQRELLARHRLPVQAERSSGGPTAPQAEVSDNCNKRDLEELQHGRLHARRLCRRVLTSVLFAAKVCGVVGCGIA